MNKFLLDTLAVPCVLLAQHRHIDHIGRRFQTGASEEQFQRSLLLVVVLLAVVVIVSLLVRWFNQRQEQGYDSPRSMFRELCRAHRLGLGERQLLRDIAAWHELPHPMLLFVELERFDTPAMVQALGRGEEIARLRYRLEVGE